MIELVDIYFERDNKIILNNINLKLEKNKFYSLTGPNGSGKSTLAKVIMGLTIPDKGKILYNGEDITNKSIDERAKLGIGFAFQTPVCFKGITVYDLLSVASNKNITKKEACDILSRVGLCALEYIDRKLDNITGHKLGMNNYHLWNYLDELKVSLKENSFNFNLIYYFLLGDVYDKYAEFLALPKLPKTKIYKILTDEDYRRECHVFNLPEREFIKLYVKCFEMDKPSVMYKNMENLINYYYEKQGGFKVND